LSREKKKTPREARRELREEKAKRREYISSPDVVGE